MRNDVYVDILRLHIARIGRDIANIMTTACNAVPDNGTTPEIASLMEALINLSLQYEKLLSLSMKESEVYTVREMSALAQIFERGKA